MNNIRVENEQLKQQLEEQRKDYFQLSKDYIFVCKKVQIQRNALEELQRKYDSLTKAYQEAKHAS